MKTDDLYKSIIKRNNLWNYYNKDLRAPEITDTDDCYRFITEYIKYSEKSKTTLFDGVRYLKEKSPQRLSHIVSTFFLGLCFFHHNREKFIHNAIVKELEKLSCFQNDPDDIDRHFAFVWFMATLFHDLGYQAEDKEDGEDMPYHNIPFKGSVPEFYKDVYKQYYEFRGKREHGIYAGLNFDRDICEIRRFQHHESGSQLDWKEELEELYHHVAWIILSHNIWLKRDNDKDVEEYKENGLYNLILSSDKDHLGRYVDYRIRFEIYPLFTLFCIIDTIEPLKTSSRLSKIYIELKKGKIIIKTNDCEYRKKVLDLNDWLAPTIINEDTITIYLE